MRFSRHSGESRNPDELRSHRFFRIPASAGMTKSRRTLPFFRAGLCATHVQHRVKSSRCATHVQHRVKSSRCFVNRPATSPERQRGNPMRFNLRQRTMICRNQPHFSPYFSEQNNLSSHGCAGNPTLLPYSVLKIR